MRLWRRGLRAALASGGVDTLAALKALTTAAGGRYWDGIASFSGLSGAQQNWAPQAGTGTLTQADGAKQPIVSTLNGLPSLLFDGSNDFVKASFTLNQSYELIIVGYFLTSVQDRTMSDGATANNAVLGVYNSSQQMRFYAGGEMNGFGPYTVPFYPSVLRIVANGNSSKYYHNGVLLGTTTSGGTANAGGLTLGGRGDGTNCANVNIAAAMALPGTTYGSQAAEILKQRYLVNQPIVLFEGDSRTAGQSWPDAAAPAGYTVLNRATAGDTVAQMIQGVQMTANATILRGNSAAKAVIWGGVNDATAGRTADQIGANLETWYTTMVAAGVRTFVCTEISSNIVPSWQGTIWPALNTRLRANIPAADLIDLGADARLQDYSNGMYYTDGTHLTSAGDAVVASIVGAKLA